MSAAGQAPKRIGRDPLRKLHDKGTPFDPGINVQLTQWSDLPSGTWLEDCLVLFSLRRKTKFFRALTEFK